MPFCVTKACRNSRSKSARCGQNPASLEEVTSSYRLSTGETLKEASANQTLVLVFLRHFGCTFTRQIIRGLQEIEQTAKQQNARLILIHMLKDGNEMKYLGGHDDVARIADPHCHLYRAFGLGKGGFMELFGPRVWLMGAIAVFQGCGMGYLAGDGRQMPGAFLLREGKILASQRARDASELPDLSALFSDHSAAASP